MEKPKVLMSAFDLLKEEEDDIYDLNLIEPIAQTTEPNGINTMSIFLNILSNVIIVFTLFHAKLLGVYSADTYSPTVFITIRSFAIFLSFSLLFLKVNNHIELPKFQIVAQKRWLCVRCISYFISFFLFINGLEYFRFSTMMCFSNTCPIFELILSKFIFKKNFKIHYLIGFIVFLIGNGMIVLNEHYDGKTILQETNKSNIFRMSIGIAIGCFHSISLAVSFIAMKKLMSSLNSRLEKEVETQIYFIGLSNTAFGLLILIFVVGFKNFDINLDFQCLVNGIVYYFACKLQNYSINGMNLIKLTFVNYLSIIQSFILVYVFFNDKIELTDIIGSLLLLFFNLYNAVYPE